MFEAGWVELDEKWQNPELAVVWQQLRQVRNEVNKVLEEARVKKLIGSSLEAKVLLYVADEQLRPTVKSLNATQNGIDELRYLFITSQVELLDSPEAVQGLEYKLQSDAWEIGIVNAEGQKCDRCWNYSTHVGESAEHPLICERCVSALAGEF